MTPEQVKDFLEAQVVQSRAELKELLKQLGHSQKERLILAIAEYPQEEAEFTADGESMVKAFSALKRCFDTNVAFGTELVLQEMQQEQLEKMKASQSEEVPEEIKEEKPAKKPRKKKEESNG
jgi:hypothetical protein